MQTIKCVVVGDGAVGKVRCPSQRLSYHLQLAHRCLIDVFADILHYEQVS